VAANGEIYRTVLADSSGADYQCPDSVPVQLAGFIIDDFYWLQYWHHVDKTKRLKVMVIVQWNAPIIMTYYSNWVISLTAFVIDLHCDVNNQWEKQD
jgi:hypothetical protein